MAPATSVFVGGGTPTLVPADGLADGAARDPGRRRRRGHRRVQPRRRHAPSCSRRTRPPVSTGSRSACSRWCRTCWRRSVAPTTRPTSNGPSPPSGPSACRRSTSTSSTAPPARPSPTGARRSTPSLALEPPHVSAYALTVEAGTPLADDPARHPDDDVQADEYELADDLLTAAGLANYEVSNWARPGHECRHNLLYWRQQDYRGFGCAAHSHRAGRRWWNLRTPERYIAAVRDGGPTEAAGESLDPEARRFEGLQLIAAHDGRRPGRRPRRRGAARCRRARRRPLGAHPAGSPDGQRRGRATALSRCWTAVALRYPRVPHHHLDESPRPGFDDPDPVAPDRQARRLD